MIDKQQAVVIARQAIAGLKIKGDRKLALQEDKTMETSFGWVFFYNTEEFLKTRDNKHRLVGNAPIIVDKNDGSYQFTGTARRIDYYIKEYERKRGLGGEGSKKS